jgi:tetratricopeptide (TPR) repeat protein
MTVEHSRNPGGEAPRGPSPWRDPLVWGVFAIALALRLLYLVDLAHTPFFTHPQMDAWFHDQWARRLAAGQGSGQDVFFRAPLYPTFLAGLYRLGADAVAVRAVQFIIGAGTAMLTAALSARRLGRWGGLGAGLIVAVYGPLIYFEGELLLVVLEAPLYLLAAWATDRALERPGPGRWLLAGAVTGAGALARPTVLAVVPVVLVAALIRGRRAAPLGAAAYAGALLAVLSPALLHNAIAGGDVVPVASQGGLNYYLGNNPDADGMAALAPDFRQTWEGGVEDARILAERAAGHPLKPSAVSSYWYRRAFAWARRDPGAFLGHQLRKLGYFWDAFEVPNNQDYYYFAGLSRLFRGPFPHAFALLAPLALAGLAGRRRLGFAWIAVPAVLMGAIVAFFVCAKFRAPLVPLFAVWAAAGIVATVEAWRSGNRRRVIVYTAVLVLAGAYVNGDVWGHRARHTPAESYLRLGIFHDLQREPEAARAAYGQALAARPGFPDAWNNLGTLDAKAGNLAAARADFVNALAARPDHPRALSNLAALAFREGKRAEADSLARRTLRVAGRSPTALYNAAVILGNLGDTETARAAFHALVDLQPGNTAARVGEARALLRLGRVPEARRVLAAVPPAERTADVNALLEEMPPP